MIDYIKGYLWPAIKVAMKFAAIVIGMIGLLLLEAWLCFSLGPIGIVIFIILIFVDIAVFWSWDNYLIDIGKKRPY